jgi:hypothetical protein
MDGLALASYAAIVATLSLAWQVYLWWHRRSSHVKVSLVTTVIAHRGGEDLQAITIVATNRSEHPVRVTIAGIERHDDSGVHALTFTSPDGGTMPGVIQPHDSGEIKIEGEELRKNGVSLYDSIAGWVQLATGELLRSELDEPTRRD